MPIPEPNFLDGSDAEKRAAFITWVERVLTQIVTHPEEWNIPLQLRAPMTAAFNQVRPLFEDLAPFAADIGLRGVEEHGLGGDQLEFKLRTVEFWANRVNQANFGTGLIRRLLDAIDTLLDSILDALGIGGSIQEIKDAIRDAIG